MNKTPFTYQRWFLRNFCAGVILFFAVLAILGLVELTKSPHNDFFWLACYLIAGIICSVITPFFFKLTRHSKLFICEGAYWVEEGTVFIETRKKTYSMNNVTSIFGKTVSFDKHNAGKLIIDYNNKTLTLISLDEEKIESFYDSGLYGLFETIRENNPELKKGEFTHFWYCLKE